MKPFSSENWTKVIQMQHACGARWEVYCQDWPPPLTICPGCQAIFKFISINANTNEASFRRIT